jgi:hypothetical protein
MAEGYSAVENKAVVDVCVQSFFWPSSLYLFKAALGAPNLFFFFFRQWHISQLADLIAGYSI